MPEMFATKKDQLKKMFSMFPVSYHSIMLTWPELRGSKTLKNFVFSFDTHFCWQKGGEDGTRSSYEKDRIQHAKRIMKPFFLRRLKSEVLTHLPTKTASVEVVPMGQQQHTMYFDRVAKYKKRAAEVKKLPQNQHPKADQGLEEMEFFFS